MLARVWADGNSNSGTLCAMVVTRDRQIFDTVARTLAGYSVALEWLTSPEQAVTRARVRRCPVLLVTADTDWRSVVQSFGTVPDRPNVVLLARQLNPGLWVQALEAGAFDVLRADGELECVRQVLPAAHRQWERRQLVWAARTRNPMSRSRLR